MQTAHHAVSDNYIIYDMSETIFSLIQQSNDEKYLPAKSYELFNEDDSECYGVDTNKHHMVTRESIENYIWLVYKATKMELECLIPAIIYLEKLLTVRPNLYLTKLRIYSKNWKTVVGMSLLLASKVWDDFHMDNASFLTVLYCMDLQRCNQLELFYLKMMNFDLSIKESEYSSYEEVIMSKRKLHALAVKKTVLIVPSDDHAATASISTGASASTLMTIATDSDPADEASHHSDKEHEVSPNKPILRGNNKKEKNWYTFKMRSNRINGLTAKKGIHTYQLNCDSYSSFLEQSSTSPQGMLAKIKCVLKGFMPYTRNNNAKISLCTF